MKKIYETNEWKGYGKQNYFRNEYRQEGNVISKVRCNRFKFFDGKENIWEETEKVVASWHIGDALMPEWLKKYI